MVETNEKLDQVVARLVEQVRWLIDELDVTADEWMQMLAFLTEVGRADEFVLLSDVLHLSVYVDAKDHHGEDGTPTNVEGPFYDDDSPELEPPYRIGRSVEDAPLLVLSGEVRNVSGRAVPGATIDVWQSDHHGLYDHQNPALPEHDLRGKLRADADGCYEFVTPIPAPYEVKNDGPVGRLLERLGRHAFRPAHIHIKVDAPGHQALTTMLFLPGDAWLDDDTIDAVKDELILKLEHPDERSEMTAGGRGQPHATARFDFVLNPLAGKLRS
ncbi:MAG: hydroxyquinol 1,2-dioxygenase [Actinobacteria bacterium]|nr:hydroxyquinol 1,2-dioxygenase [Actinomycetota bacterium]